MVALGYCIAQENSDWGQHIFRGFNEALQQGADYIGQMDADFSHPIEKIVPMAEALAEYDFVIGSRYISGGHLDERWPLWRRALSGWATFTPVPF